MFDFEQFLQLNLDDMKLKVWRHETDNHIEIFGNPKGLAYLAARILDLVQNDYPNFKNAELNLDRGVDLTEESASVCIFLTDNDGLLR